MGKRNNLCSFLVSARIYDLESSSQEYVGFMKISFVFGHLCGINF